ncbi:hypothetical protein [Streptomyces omiyaensis]|uniref:hypothetical protein n=1 Tax=Streptomyces omiyaensis TaxID=68247 RepID=UPI001677D50A|nr:hypothetical protein [Streptomyces omiyaensis]GGY61409.1 hypothetical protein GCM10010363_48800 [Streptomyces omiyaensis]
MRPAAPRARAALAALLTALALALLPAVPAHPAPAEGDPAVAVSQNEAAKGGEITVSGTGWKAGALLMVLLCGQGTPEKGVVGGTNSCANTDGRAATVDPRGAFSVKLPVVAPPRPCPCVVHVSGVTGQQDVVDAALAVAGHATAPLPDAAGDGRLAVLTAARLDGSGGVLTWFGAPPARTLVLTVGNLGTAPVRDPVFTVGTARGVLAPTDEEHRWSGTIAPGQKARIELEVELPAGAHGDHRVSVSYGGKLLAEQPWRVGRPWGVVLFWALLAVVVPAALFRIGMVLVDRAGGRNRHSVPVPVPADADGPGTTAVLPWFLPDSAPSENSPTTKGHS